MRYLSRAIFLLATVTWSTALAQETRQSPHGKMSWDCLDCHNTESWENLKPPLKFKHEETGFALVGQHAKAACGVCHRDQRFSYVGTACADCHIDVHRGQLGTTCQNCHAPQNWQNRRDNFELHASRGFPLVGVHAITDCGACHVGQETNEFAGVSQECQICHRSNFESSTNPNHTQAGFSSNCRQCHQPVAASWRVTSFKHSGAFSLRGRHAGTDCAECHITQYRGTSAECNGCHAQDFNATTNPAHTTFGFPTTCEACHNDMGWETAQFDHLQVSQGFALNGAHGAITCVQCHINNQLQGIPRECYGCHQDDYMATTDPSHSQNNFPQTCLTCHNENAWVPATFDHNLSQFPLTGAHVSVACNSCHAGGYQNTPTACYACHQSDYNSVTDPNHVQNNFDHICTVCHTTAAWQPSTFNHASTQFPLTGAHTTVACVSCHANGYQNTPTDCYSCHADNYNSATDPNHVQNNFAHDCTQCHSTAAWQPSTFNHANTQFPLTGAHATLSCVSCHAGGYNNTPTACYACHQDDYDGASDPNHAQNNFGHDCTQCHNTTAWQPSTFNHANTQFPLTGAHVQLQCIQCHANGYQIPFDCWSCHEADYHGAENHDANNFPHDCTLCHNTSSWGGALFNHANTQFPLTGAHISLQCIACHSTGYQNIPIDCYACHQSAYNNAVPNHQAAGFPTTCQNCHSTSAWIPSTWNHDALYFPIYSGRHQGRWTICADCHVNPNDFNIFECIFCHEHNQPDTDGHHTGVPNYQYNSQACYACHPRGEAGGR